MEVAAEADNVRDAILNLKNGHFDVIFLDINMPGVSGMQLADALTKFKSLPSVVFVTAYSDYAASAFDVNAIDYLVKPVETDRLRQAVNKVMHHRGIAAKQVSSERISVEKGGKKVLVPAGDIRLIMAKDDYSCLLTSTGHYLTTTSLAKLETRLVNDGFFRVHRRYIVNLDYIKEVETVTGGTLKITLRDGGEEIPVSRRRVVPLKKKLKL